jgi:FkbM family methyltransferase
LVLDVGANTGQFASRLRQAGFGGRIVSFEPVTGSYEQLARNAAGDRDWECRQIALGDRDASATIHLSGNSSNSSLLRMDEKFRRLDPSSAYVGRERIEVVRLDTIWHEIVRRDEHPYLKVDVQGYELPVLKGAVASLDQLAFVECELALVPLYEGAPRYDKILMYLESRGFQLVSIEPVYEDPATGRMLYVDGIFMHES